MTITASVALSLLVCYHRANRLIPNGIYFALQPRHTADEDLSLRTGLLEEEDEDEDEDATQLDDRMLDNIRYRDGDDSIEDVSASKNQERSLIDDSNKPTAKRNDFGVFSIADEDD